MLYEQIASNKRKSFLLVFLFFIIIFALGYAIGLYWANPYAGMIIAGMFAIFYVPLAYFSGDSMILSMSGARLATKKDNAYLVNTVEGLAIAAGIPTPKIYVINDTAINAFATGRKPENAAITVTTGALEKLKRIELEGVIAHEMSHIKNYDIRLMMLAVVLAGLVTLLGDFFLRSMWYGRGSRDDNKGGGAAIFLLIGIALAILAPIISELLKLAISRKREFLADADGALLTRYPKGLADALKRIKEDKDPYVDTANRATACLYISNPLRGSKKFLDGLFSTHPPLEQRIKNLEAM